MGEDTHKPGGKREPTNADIIYLMEAMKEESHRHHTEVSQRLIGVEDQVKYTNGRVKALETRAERADAVEEYKKNNPPANVSVQTTNVTQIDWQKIVLGLVGALTVALTVAAAVVGAK